MKAGVRKKCSTFLLQRALGVFNCRSLSQEVTLLLYLKVDVWGNVTVSQNGGLDLIDGVKCTYELLEPLSSLMDL